MSDDLTEMSVSPYYIPRVYDNTLYVPLTVSEPTLDHLVEKGFGPALKRLLVNDFHDVESLMGNCSCVNGGYFQHRSTDSGGGIDGTVTPISCVIQGFSLVDEGYLNLDAEYEREERGEDILWCYYVHRIQGVRLF